MFLQQIKIAKEGLKIKTIFAARAHFQIIPDVKSMNAASLSGDNARPR